VETGDEVEDEMETEVEVGDCVVVIVVVEEMGVGVIVGGMEVEVRERMDDGGTVCEADEDKLEVDPPPVGDAGLVDPPNTQTPSVPSGIYKTVSDNC
jgi:hypothetical protein